jgi:hypothetical protein
MLSVIFFCRSAARPNHAFGPPTQFSLLIFDLQTLAPTFGLPRPPRRSSLCCPPPILRSRLASSPSPPSKMATTYRLPISISCNRCHWSFIAVPSLPLTAWLPPPYDSIKGAIRALPLSTASISASIYPPHVRNHLPIGASPIVSVKCRRVAISIAPPPSGVISENPNDLLSLSFQAITTTSRASERPRCPMVTSPQWTESQPWSCDP